MLILWNVESHPNKLDNMILINTIIGTINLLLLIALIYRIIKLEKIMKTLFKSNLMKTYEQLKAINNNIILKK